MPVTKTTHVKTHHNLFSRAEIDLHRAYPYAHLLPALACTQSPTDPNVWFSPSGITICVEKSGLPKFTDFATKRGGGGAIDLVMHLRSVSFLNAVQFISELPSVKFPDSKGATA